MIKLEVKNAGLSKLKATQAELEATQAELEAIQAELEASQTQVEVSQNKLRAYQVEQEATKAKLEATQAELEAIQAELETTQKYVVQLKKQVRELKMLQAKDTIDLSKPPPSGQTVRFPAWILLPMRIFLGLTFIYAGIQKLTDPQFFNPAMPEYIGHQIKFMAQGSPLHDFLMNVALPHAMLFGWMTALGEIAIGLATYAGFLFRPAAFFGMMLSLTFFLTASWNTYPYFYGSDIVFVFCWVTMILSGPLNTGLPSIDDWLLDYLIPEGDTQQDLPIALQLYILLVVAGTPQKVSYIKRINLFGINLIGIDTPRQSHKPQTAQTTRRSIIHDFVLGAATVASVTLLGIPLRVFSRDPNESTTDTTSSPATTSGLPDTTGTSTTSTASIAPTTPTARTQPTAHTPHGYPVTTTSPTARTQPTARAPHGYPVTTTSPTADIHPTPTSPATTVAAPPPVRLVSVGQGIATLNQIPKNSVVKFLIDTAGSQDSAVLIHLPNDKLVAYDTVCTHAGCTVEYQPDTHILTCPCHNSQFDPAHNGTVLHGPAIVPLTQLSIQVTSAGVIELKSIPS
jgi:thiosulfate dehydrogenase [quinone] large subunit